MKVFENRSIFKKLIMIFILITIVSFCVPNNVKASNEIGGKLLKPIVDLVLSLSDGAYGLVHKVIFKQDITLLDINLSTGFWENLWKGIKTIAIFIAVAVVATVAVLVTAGVATAVVGALTGITLGTVSAGTVVIVSVIAGSVAVGIYNSNAYPDDILSLPLYSISPQEIFSNEIPMFDVDFFNPDAEELEDKNGNKVMGRYLTDNEGNVINDSDGEPIIIESTAATLRSAIASWYIVLRDIALVALLSVLVFIGIKIIISSTSSDKAKYKQMLVDWIVAICLLFFMQYIMTFSNLIVGKITEVIKDINYKDMNLQVMADKEGKISDGLKDDYDYTDEQLEQLYVKKEDGSYLIDDNGDKLIYWNTNLIGVARLNAQMSQSQSALYAGYTLIFLVLVFYTIFFIVTYIKRIIYMAFLTIIAPLVALTYPIDKINDGKAQAFDMWCKEYTINLLIQPMHLILYTILVTTAFELASSNIIYALVAIGFIIPSEKLFRKFFGFEKAQTPGLLAGPAGAAAAMGLMKTIFSKGPKDVGNAKGGSSSNGGQDDDGRIRSREGFDTQGSMLGDGLNGDYTSYSNSTTDNDDTIDSNNTNRGNNQSDYDNSNRNSSDNSASNGGRFSNDNIYDLSEDEYSIRDADIPLLPDNSMPNPLDNNPSGSGPSGGGSNGSGPNGGAPNGGNHSNSNSDGIRFNDDNIYDLSEDEYSIRNANENYSDNTQQGGQNGNGSHSREMPRNASNSQQNTNTNASPASQRMRVSRPKPKKNYMNAIKTGAKYYGKGLLQKAGNSIKNSHPVKRSLRTLGGAALGATAGSIALAAGIASGDPTKAFQYTVAGVAGGYKLGSNTVGATSRALTVDGIEDMQKRAMYDSDEDYEEAKRQEYIKNYQRDLNNQYKLEKKYGSREAKQIMKNVVPDYLEHGIRNMDDIMAGYELEKNGIVKEDENGQRIVKSVDRAQAISTAKYVARMGGKDTTDMKKKDRDEWHTTFTSEFEGNDRIKNKAKDMVDEEDRDRVASGRGAMSDRERRSKQKENTNRVASGAADNTMDCVDAFSKIRFS